jgi:hypothetical protein
MASIAVVGLAAAAVSGCPRQAPPAGPDAAPTSAVDNADAGPPDTGVPEVDAGPRPLTFEIHAQSGDRTRQLIGGGENDGIWLDARFVLELPPLKDARVRLFDDADKAVPSADRAELTTKALRYELVPSEPLAPGSKYALVVDGLTEDFPKDAQGRAFDLARVEFRSEGEKPKAAGSKKAQKTKKKP